MSFSALNLKLNSLTMCLASATLAKLLTDTCYVKVDAGKFFWLLCFVFLKRTR